MAKFLHHGPCPKCGSKDNRAFYDDGSEWCFGCRSYTPGRTNINEFSLKPKTKMDSNISVTLPEGTSAFLPKAAENWLTKWNLTDDELSSLDPRYCYPRELLIFPVYDEDDSLLMWQGRYFGENPAFPKYITKGDCGNILHIIYPCGPGSIETSPSIVVVEDLISATKVGSVTPAMPLWGSNLSLYMGRRLAARFVNLTIWLDKDKAVESLKQKGILSPLFSNTTCVITDKDPKYFNHTEIEEILK